MMVGGPYLQPEEYLPPTDFFVIDATKKYTCNC